MKKFLKICAELRAQQALTFKRVDGWFRYLKSPINDNRYLHIELIRVPKPQVPYALIQFS